MFVHISDCRIQTTSATIPCFLRFLSQLVGGVGYWGNQRHIQPLMFDKIPTILLQQYARQLDEDGLRS